MPGVSQPFFTLFIHFRGQRFKSRAFPCACEPRIEEGFLIELHKEKQGYFKIIESKRSIFNYFS
jgi:centrosomal protein CEP76